MPTSQADVRTAHASRYLQQLCKHWAHKFPVEFTPEKGSITLPAGVTELSATADTLSVTIRAADEPSLDRLEQVVGEHIIRFAFREELAFEWKRGG